MVYKTDAPGATVNNEYTEGDPSTGVPATKVAAEHLNMFQRELVAVVTAAGLVPTKGVDDQLKQALLTGLLVDRLIKGDTGLLIPNAGGHVLLKHLTAGAQLTIESGVADALANLLLREPGVGRGWHLAAGAASEVLQLGFEAATGAGAVGKFTFDKAGNLNSLGNAAKANNGYCRLTNGLIAQWGRHTATINPADASVVVNFPLAFPNSCLAALAVGRNPSSLNTQGAWAEIVGYTAAQLTVYAQFGGGGSSSLTGFQWMAIGD